MARTGEIPHRPYYGSVDATPLFSRARRRVRELHERHRARRTTSPRPSRPRSAGFSRSLRRRSARSAHVRHRPRRPASQPGLEGQLRRRLLSGWSAGLGTHRARRGPGLRGRWARARGAFALARRQNRARRVARRTRGSASRSHRRALYFDESGACALAIDGEGVPRHDADFQPRPSCSSAGGHARARAQHRRRAFWRAGCGPDGAFALSAPSTPPTIRSATIAARSGRTTTRSSPSAWLATAGRATPCRCCARMYEASLHFRHFQLPELFCGMGLRRRRLSGSLSGRLLPAGLGFGGALPLASRRPRDLRRCAAARASHLQSNACRPGWARSFSIGFTVGNTRLKLRFSRTGAACAVDVLEQEGDPIRVLVELSPNG